MLSLALNLEPLYEVLRMKKRTLSRKVNENTVLTRFGANVCDHKLRFAELIKSCLYCKRTDQFTHRVIRTFLHR